MKTKKLTDKPWHPNFRQVATLPDVSVVRSSFFINLILLTLAFCLFAYWMYIELQVNTLSGLLKQANVEIAFREKNDAMLLKANEGFEAYAKTIEEIQDFTKAPFLPSQFLEEVGSAMQANMQMRSMEYEFEGRTQATRIKGSKKKKITNHVFCIIKLTGVVSGSSRQATTAIETFREDLVKLPLLQSVQSIGAPQLESFDRDLASDTYVFSLEMEVEL